MTVDLFLPPGHSIIVVISNIIILEEILRKEILKKYRSRVI